MSTSLPSSGSGGGYGGDDGRKTRKTLERSPSRSSSKPGSNERHHKRTRREDSQYQASSSRGRQILSQSPPPDSHGQQDRGSPRQQAQINQGYGQPQPVQYERQVYDPTTQSQQPFPTQGGSSLSNYGNESISSDVEDVYRSVANISTGVRGRQGQQGLGQLPPLDPYGFQERRSDRYGSFAPSSVRQPQDQYQPPPQTLEPNLQASSRSNTYPPSLDTPSLPRIETDIEYQTEETGGTGGLRPPGNRPTLPSLSETLYGLRIPRLTENPGGLSMTPLQGHQTQGDYQQPTIEQTIMPPPVAPNYPSSLQRPQRYPCSECDLVFSKKEYLDRHVKTHTGKRQMPCTLAGCTSDASFRDASNLAQHLTRRHPEVSDPKAKAKSMWKAYHG